MSAQGFFSVAFASQNWKQQKTSHSSRTSKIFIQGTEAPWVRTFSPEISIGTMTSRDATNGFTKDLVQGVHVCPFTGPGDIHGPTHYLAWQHLLHLHFKKLTCRIMQNQIAVQPKNLQKFSEKKNLQKNTSAFTIPTGSPRHSSEPGQAGWIEPSERNPSKSKLQRHGIQGNLL